MGGQHPALCYDQVLHEYHRAVRKYERRRRFVSNPERIERLWPCRDSHVQAVVGEPVSTRRDDRPLPGQGQLE